MTTAARPTWAPAKGGNEQGGTRIFGPSQKYSSRDLAAHTTLKPRREGQDTHEELQKRNLREELEERERRHFSSKDKTYAEERDRRKGASAGHLLLEGTKRDAEDRLLPRNVDADDSDVDVKSEDESDDEDDDEDDTLALMAELERIRKERAEEKLRKERQQQEGDLKAKEADLIRGNPLLNNATSFNVKRRWDDDVVFKNQTRGEAKTPKRFINDTIRNDFHRKFLQKYMK
ncbi:cwf15 / Cwc15 cell cycle control family protein [Tasmannia lanceolata]|uniref:cwf15 / Cwc15 cell cycle control family protein n=1 Tax=Tasmannia lanceolata TaxID=3420 RepID=UPI004063BF8B